MSTEEREKQIREREAGESGYVDYKAWYEEMRHKWNDVLKHEDIALANCRRLESELERLRREIEAFKKERP